MHRKSIEKIYEEFNSNPSGLNVIQVQEHFQKYGPNTITTKEKKSWTKIFLKQFMDLMAIILIVAATLTYFFGEKTDTVVITIVIILNATISFIQEYQAENAIAALKKMITPRAKVLREGRQMEIDASMIVPGDIIILHEGDHVPADARLIEANQLECNEAILTGESNPVKKDTITLRGKNLPKIEHSNSIFMGTTITHGTGKAIVFATGDKTEFGKIATLTSTTKQDISPLQKELKKIGVFVAITTLGLSILLLLAGYFVQGKSIVDSLIFTVSVAVAAVPEGLPTTITIALALGVKTLAKKKAIIKQLSSVETLGSTTVILSDKTGTLTKNEMTVKELHFNKDTFAEIKGIGYEPIGEIEISRPNIEPIIIGQNETTATTSAPPLESLEKHNRNIFESLKLIALTGTLCSEAKLVDEDDGTHSVIGDPTEGAILTMVEKAGFSFENFENKYSFLAKLPFDSSRKMMSVVVKHLHTSEILVLTKGAPQALLDKCTGIFVDGKKIDLDKDTRAKILKNNEEMAKGALRVIAFAYKEMPRKEKDIYTEAATENNLTFLGLAGMMDPPRKETREAIAMTKEAGIKTYIVTGDDGFTAHAIANQIGLIDPKNCEIITGEDLNKISDSKLKKMLSEKTKDYVFARVSPQHKLKLTNILKELGEVVAVTGDGVNDAPALKRADIGIAMGIKGTDVSKETANMVLADDSFVSIVKAIEQGRTIYQNMRKFIFYIFSGNIGELITIFAAILINVPAPLTAILILCVNLGTDIFPALALATEPPNKDIMSRPPRKISNQIMSPMFVLRFVYTGILIGAIVLGIFIWNLYRYGWMWGESIDTSTMAYTKSVTMAFAAIVVIQFFNVYNARSHNRSVFRLGFIKNPYILLSVIASAAILFAITEISVFKTYLKLTSLTSTEWVLIFISSSAILAVEEIRKTFVKISEQ